MTGFDFVFALFSLLLGLAIAEVLSGFARVLRIEARARVGMERNVRVGWLVPLLATWLLLDQLTFWLFAYSVRDTLPLNYITLLAVTVVVGGYYLFSTLVFPDSPEDWPDFDRYYDQHNRLILIGMFVTRILLTIVGNIYRPPMTSEQAAIWASSTGDFLAFATIGAILANIALIFVKGRRKNAVLLASLIAFTVGAAIVIARAGL